MLHSLNDKMASRDISQPDTRSLVCVANGDHFGHRHTHCHTAIHPSGAAINYGKRKPNYTAIIVTNNNCGERRELSGDFFLSEDCQPLLTINDQLFFGGFFWPLSSASASASRSVGPTLRMSDESQR